MASKWTNPPTEYGKKVTREHHDRLRRAVLMALRGVVLRTPVGNPSLWKSPPPKGYVGGRARANWQLTKGSAAEGVLDVIDETGSGALAQDVGIEPFDVIYLTNNVPYAERLEHGWSTQAPAGMVSVTLLELVERLS